MRNIRGLFVVIAVVLCMVSSVSAAGEKMQKEVDLGTSIQTGVVDKQSAMARVAVSKGHLHTRSEVIYEETEGARTEDSAYGWVSYDPPLSDTWSLWFSEYLGHNSIRQIVAESQTGAGVKYVISAKATKQISLSIGQVYHYIRYTDGIDEIVRVSVRPKVRVDVDKWTFEFIGFYQPSVRDFSDDYIVSAELGLRLAVTAHAGVKLLVEDTYRSVSRVDENNELRTTLAASYRF